MSIRYTLDMKNLYNIAIVITPDTSLSSALSMYDIFNFINESFETSTIKLHIDFIRTEEDVTSVNRLMKIETVYIAESSKHYDFIFFPLLKSLTPPERPNQETLSWLHRSDKMEKSILCASCTSTYILAYADLLQGKSATTHWSLEDDFTVRFPTTRLNIHKLIVDEGNIITSGGGYAYIDLCFYIINKFISHEVAYHTAKYLLVDMGRISQTYFKTLSFQVKNNDQDIEKLLQWIENNIMTTINVNDMARYLSISHKTLIRKFKHATGILPREYIQNLKVEKAKYLLVNGDLSFTDITGQLGYSNPSSFRVLFKKYTNLNPQEYRKKFINLSV